MTVTKCYGNEFKCTHAPGCRPGRPLCKWRRKATSKYHVCNCPAYFFPHRSGSGLCGHPERRWSVQKAVSEGLDIDMLVEEVMA